jgi:HEPN domain-containing protein
MPPESSQRWFDFADEDLDMAALALDHAPYNQVCFHAQQAAEKIMKGLLASGNEGIPKTHRLTDLLQLVKHRELRAVSRKADRGSGAQ